MDNSFFSITEIIKILSADPLWSAIFFLILCFTLLIFSLSRRQALLNDKFKIMEGKIDQLTRTLSSTNVEVASVKTAVGGVEDTLSGVNKVAEDTKRDVANLSDGISGETQVSTAIELARERASLEKIVASTGISKEEAEAVVRFHKPDV